MSDQRFEKMIPRVGSSFYTHYIDEVRTAVRTNKISELAKRAASEWRGPAGQIATATYRIRAIASAVRGGYDHNLTANDAQPSDVKSQEHNYWATTQWPSRIDEEENEPRCGVYLPDGREDAGADLKPGDLVAVYEAKKGRSLIRKDISGNKEVVKCRTGRQGIVALLKVTSKLCADDDITEQRYTDGTKIWWRWYADAEQYSASGFVPRQELNRILGYALGNPLKGFGDNHSGLKKVTKEQFEQIIEQFQKHGVSSAVEKMIKGSAARGGHAWGRGESEIHKKLKERIAASPAKILGETGLVTEKVEFQFPTNDRADILLWDAQGRVIGVEIEPGVANDQPEGILQAIKYRYMAALMFNKRFEDSRSFLVAHNISDEAKEVCELYGVEYFVIPRG